VALAGQVAAVGQVAAAGRDTAAERDAAVVRDTAAGRDAAVVRDAASPMQALRDSERRALQAYYSAYANTAQRRAQRGGPAPQGVLDTLPQRSASPVSALALLAGAAATAGQLPVGGAVPSGPHERA
jgi:hypothetical protein